MPFERARYPASWPDMARAAKEAAGWRCGVPQAALGVSGRNRPYRIVLAACHLDHDPANPTPRLAVYCQACHLRHDAMERWRGRRRRAREQALAAGQLPFAADGATHAPADGASSGGGPVASLPALAAPLGHWPERDEVTTAVFARMRRAAGRPLTLIQRRTSANAAPELRAHDAHLARFLVAVVEESIARHAADGRRALVLLDQEDATTIAGRTASGSSTFAPPRPASASHGATGAPVASS